LKSLAKFFKKISKEKNIFWGLGIAFSVMIATIGLVGFVLLSAFVVRNWFERYILESALFRLTTPTESVSIIKPSSPLPKLRNPLFDLFNVEKEKSLFAITPGEAPPLPPQEVLGYETFYDLFSGNGWIDQSQTSLYHERIMTAFLFSPKFTFTKTAETKGQFLGQKQDGSDERCIRGRCLKVQGNKLSFQGNRLSLPEGVQSSEIVGVSIGALERIWTVGVTTRSGENYLGWLFTFDGNSFKDVQREGKEIFVSRYAGIIGFGGGDNEWMAIYGAYEGKAVLVKSGVINDISRFFGIRVMAGGINPEITRIGSGNEATWFVWNKGEAPKLIKLFQNGTSEIKGAVDFTNEFGANLQDVTSMYIAVTPDEHALFVKMTRNGEEEYWRFVDEGFDIAESKQITSASLTNRILPVVLASIANLEYADADAKIEFALSNDGVDWEKAEIGKTITFVNQKGDKLFWRIRVDAPENQFFSPYFGQIEVDYAIKKSS
jgi:hypothetical protein